MTIFAAKINPNMETVSFTFNPNSPFAASLENFMKTVPASVKVTKKRTKPAIKKKARKTGIERAMDDIKAGRVHKAASVEEMMDQIFG